MKKISRVISVLLVAMLCFSTSLSVIADEPVSIETGELSLAATSYVYTGSEIKPAVTVKVGTTTVAKKYLQVSYADNINAGTATVSVTGVDKYQGTLSTTFKITKQDITSSSIKKTVEKLVVGKKPVVKLSYNGKKLVKDRDYTLTYSNTSKVGVKTGKITIKGIGNYNTKKTYNVNVYPKKVFGITNVKREETAVTIKWNSQADLGVSGYKVYTCDEKGENTKLRKTVTEPTAKITKLEKGKYYYFVIKAYKKNSERIIYGDVSNVYKTCSKPEKVTVTSAALSSDNKKVVVQWNKVPSTGYQVKYSTDKTFKTDVKTAELIDSSSTTYKFDAKSTKTYYVKVRAFRKFNGKTVYGKWSSRVNNAFSNLYATYSSNYVNNPDRTTNLKIASKAISGTILQPGDTFSFNKVVGKRTTAKGYKSAHVFSGSSVVMGTGGGVCQVASTMFNTTLLANLTIVERHQHSQRVSYVPLGRDAAIYWGSEDYKFKNNTNYAIKIKMTVKDGKITCAMYTCQNVKPKSVKLKVSRSGNNFTLKRYVGGKCNYTTHSHY